MSMFLLRSKLDSKSSTFILLMGGGGRGELRNCFFALKNSKPTLVLAISRCLVKQFTCVSSKWSLAQICSAAHTSFSSQKSLNSFAVIWFWGKMAVRAPRRGQASACHVAGKWQMSVASIALPCCWWGCWAAPALMGLCYACAFKQIKVIDRVGSQKEKKKKKERKKKKESVFLTSWQLSEVISSGKTLHW